MKAIDPLPVTLLWRVQVLPRSHGLRYERLSAPLTQAMVVLWLAGIGHLFARLAEGRPGWAWVFSAGLGAMVGALFAGRFRRAGLVAISLVLGVGAWLAALHRLGFTTTESMLGALTAYALIAWAASVWVLRQPWALRLAGTLRLCGGYGPDGGRVTIERTAHAATMGLCLAGVAVAIGGLLDARVALDLDLLPVPAIAAGFWCTSAWRYRKRGHVYLMLAALTLGVLIVYGRSVSTVLWQLAADPGAGLALVLLALMFLVAAQAAEHSRDPAGRARTLYPVPLAHTAVALGFVAAGLQVCDITLRQRIDGTLPSLVVALGGMVLLWGNRRAMSFRLDLMGLMFLVLALLCAQLVWFHDGRAGTALTDPGLADLWVTLAIVSLLLGLGADAVHRWPGWAGRLSGPWQVAAGLCYGSALLAGLALATFVPWHRDPASAWVMLALAWPFRRSAGPSRWPCSRRCGVSVSRCFRAPRSGAGS